MELYTTGVGFLSFLIHSVLGAKITGGFSTEEDRPPEGHTAGRGMPAVGS